MPYAWRAYILVGMVMVLYLLLTEKGEDTLEGITELAKTSPIPITVELVAVALVVVGTLFWPYVVIQRLVDAFRKGGD